MAPIVSAASREDLAERRLVHSVTRDVSEPDDACGVDDEPRGVGDVNRIVGERDVDAPTLRAGAVVVDQDRERE